MTAFEKKSKLKNRKYDFLFVHRATAMPTFPIGTMASQSGTLLAN